MSLHQASISNIELKDVSIGHSHALVDNINYRFSPGHVSWLTGPSGGGKSTLMRTLAGLINPLKGEYRINGDLINDFTFEDFLPYRLNIGYSFDTGGLINNRTLYDNLMLPILYHKLITYEEAEERVGNLLKIFAMSKYRNERPASVPGGVRKAACVARAFVMDPKVLLLDEPTTGLNDEGLEALDFLVKRYKRQNDGIVIVTSRTTDYVDGWADTEVRMTGSLFLARDRSRNQAV